MAIFGARQGRRRGRGPDRRLVAAGVAGVLGVGWLVTGAVRRGEGPAPVALAAPGALDAIAPPDGPTPSGGGGGGDGAKEVPPGYLDGLSNVPGADALALAGLRHVAVACSSAPEGPRAMEALEGERARCEALAAQHEAAGRLEEALTALTRQWLTTLDRTQRRALRPRLQQLSEKVHTGPTPPATMILYTVAKGDSLWKIAQKNQTEHAALQRINRISDRTLRIGQRLRVPCAPVTVVALKRDFEVVVLLGPNALRVYDVATGKDGKTPEATFKIGTKMVDPDWYSPEGKLYKFGTPENVLGTRWLAFENTDQHQGFGIHGTRFPESIGTEASMGCLRMRNEEVEELYDYVPKGSTVRIVK